MIVKGNHLHLRRPSVVPELGAFVHRWESLCMQQEPETQEGRWLGTKVRTRLSRSHTDTALPITTPHCRPSLKRAEIIPQKERSCLASASKSLIW